MSTETEVKVRLTEEEYYRVFEWCKNSNLLLLPIEHPRHFYDTYYDFENHNLRTQDKFIRIREINEEGQKNNQTYITFKGPNEDSVIQVREEIELEIPSNSCPGMIDIWKKCFGLQSSVVIDKKRYEFNIFDKSSTTICLDKVHDLGHFMEIESSSKSHVQSWLGKIQQECNFKAEIEDKGYPVLMKEKNEAYAAYKEEMLSIKEDHERQLFELVTQRPILHINEYDNCCPFCASTNIEELSNVTTLVARPEKGPDPNHRCRLIICQNCKNKYKIEYKLDNVWITTESNKILFGLPNCFEDYIYTCSKCGADVQRQYINKNGSVIDIKIISAEKGKQYLTRFFCKDCGSSKEIEIDYWGDYPNHGWERGPQFLRFGWVIQEEIGVCIINNYIKED